MKSAGKARNNGLYRHIRTSKEIIRNLLNDYNNYLYLNYADTALAADISSVSSVMIGERYDTVNKKLELLYGHYNKQEIKDGIFTTIKYDGPYLEWKSE